MPKKTTDERLLDRFSDLDKRPDFPTQEIKKKVAIVSTPRCGSTLFCDVLGNTDLVGFPSEWINVRYFKAYMEYFGYKSLSLNTYLNFIFRKTVSSNGVFSINFHIEQYIKLLESKLDIFKLNFDHAYYLFRKEKLDQAYSLAKASITDQWSSNAAPSREISGEISREKVLTALLHISRSEQYYSEKIQNRIDREFSYEDFSQLDTTSAFTDVMSDLGIAEFDPVWKTSTRKQSSNRDNPELENLKQYLFPGWIPGLSTGS